MELTEIRVEVDHLHLVSRTMRLLYDIKEVAFSGENGRFVGREGGGEGGASAHMDEMRGKGGRRAWEGRWLKKKRRDY